MNVRAWSLFAGLVCCAVVGAQTPQPPKQPPKATAPSKPKTQPKTQPKQKGPSNLPEGARMVRDLVYVRGGHFEQKLDLYLPAPSGRLRPLVIWIHGGAWTSGDKGGGPWQPLLREGYAIASINYRLSQHAPFPAQIEDCKAAVRWLRANASGYDIDPNRFGAWGSSAGGHLAALLGTTGSVTEWDILGAYIGQSSRVQAVCDWFGPTDLTQMGKQAGATSRIDHDAAGSPESRLIGGPIQENKDRAAKANPITFVSKDSPPFLIMHGDKDDTVPHGQSVLLEQALEKAGVPVTFHTVKGAGHGFTGPEPMRMVIEFFDKHLKR